jgi:sugar-specific transcriptional regulator TrmB
LSSMKLPFDHTLFDLERRDLKVYETMLTNPEARSIRTIATHVKMNRGTAFDIIKKLVKLGLVAAYNRGSRKYYRAEPPASLTRYADERRKAVIMASQEVEEYARQLEEMQPEAATGPFGKQYEGEEEIAVLLSDVLATVAVSPDGADRSYRVISSAEVSNHLYGKFRNFSRQRIRQGISVRVISVGRKGRRAELAERKALSAKDVPASYIIIYGDKVAHITLTSLGNIQGSVVEDKGIVQLQRLLFDKLWQSL